MPTYEYECAKCGKTFELFQSMKDAPLKTCIEETCKGEVRRLLGTGAGIIFKGSGFYQTDYRSTGYKEAAKSETAKQNPPATEKKAESKPASSQSDKTKK